MDWLKRNWVDVLMGGLILAVVGGFVTLLLRGDVFRGNPNATNPPSQTAPSSDTSSDTITTVPAPTGTAQPQPTPTVKPAPNPTPSVKPKPLTPSSTAASLDVPSIPTAPVETPSATQNTKPANTASNQPSNNIPSTANSNPIRQPVAQTATAVIPKVTAPSSRTESPAKKPVTTTGNYSRAEFLRNYRIATGSYSSLERAQTAVAQLRSRGLPAQAFSSGKTYVVVVGPYSRQSAARIALNKVRQFLPDAILYRPDGSKETIARVAKPAAVPVGGGGGGQASLTAELAYLQVGAFKDSKSASVLLTRLKNAGFTVLTKNISGLLRVLIGPLPANQIQITRSELKTQGFEAFPINL